MTSDKSKKKTTLDWVLLVVILIVVAVGGYFLYQKVIKYMIWPEKVPQGEFTVVIPPGGGSPIFVPKTSVRIPSVSSFEDIFGAGGGAEELL